VPERYDVHFNCYAALELERAQDGSPTVSSFPAAWPLPAPPAVWRVPGRRLPARSGRARWRVLHPGGV